MNFIFITTVRMQILLIKVYSYSNQFPSTIFTQRNKRISKKKLLASLLEFVLPENSSL